MTSNRPLSVLLLSKKKTKHNVSELHVVKHIRQHAGENTLIRGIYRGDDGSFIVTATTKNNRLAIIDVFTKHTNIQDIVLSPMGSYKPRRDIWIHLLTSSNHKNNFTMFNNVFTERKGEYMTAF